MMKTLPNIHPGEILLEEFLTPLGISQNRLARAMDVPPRRINEIVHGKRAITADTALRLARALGTSEQFWMGVQADYDLEEARISFGNKLNKIENVAAWTLEQLALEKGRNTKSELDVHIPTTDARELALTRYTEP